MAKKSYEFIDLSFQEERELELEKRKNRLEAICYKICLRCKQRKPYLSIILAIFRFGS